MTHCNRTSTLLIAGCLLSGALGDGRAKDFFSDWPSGRAPKEIGRSVALNFVERKFDFETNPKRKYVIYPEACTWYGALAFADAGGERDLREKLVRKFDFLLTAEGAKRISPDAHVDYRVFGIVPLELYLETKEPKFLEMGKRLADEQWKDPSPDGITAEARYWIDDMYMIPAVQVQAFRATGDARYLDRAALAMAAYLDRLQQPNGLFFHGTNSPFFWSRGNGWMAAGMAELLRSLPAQHPKRARLLEGCRKMMAALLQCQDKAGVWHQLLDDPDAWAETSGTGMFAFALITGVKCGWLDADIYGPAARKAWLGLTTYINTDGNVRDVCVGTNKGSSHSYYIERPRKTGDLHGQAPVLWCAAALLR
jgi:rhamnogalacturonyl hydrolase YesR